ncbi:hypothetical protein [Sphingosinicella sp. BN140058]|uniref:hypothetical protein n=1 Tax=Sphingosinicella sp. BN140058 TaxID=1892855 RepID=UPI00101021EB|nr:hypothetical protein [Sphingosinicella sp. BN140058]QAY78411.1 hypothetical protein ETR14_19120 [Sphingosinicella sp. BN140058]
MRPYLLAAATLLVSLSAVPAAAKVASETWDPDQVVCVPLRDKQNQPTSAQACRTAAQWKGILKRHAAKLRTAALPVQPFTPLWDYGFRSDVRPGSRR